MTADVCFVFKENSGNEQQINFYQCALDDAPRHIHQERNVPNPAVAFFGRLPFEFTQRDIEAAERRVCDDGVTRLEIRVKTTLQVYSSGRIVVLVKSLDGRLINRECFRLMI